MQKPTLLVNDLFVIFQRLFCVYGRAPCACSASKGQKMALDSPELEL